MRNLGNPLTEYSPQMESENYESYEYPQGEQYEQQESWGETAGEGSYEGVFNEQEEMELAAELLEVTNEQELEQFLGGLIGKVGGAIGKFGKSKAGKGIFGALKGIAKKALPIAGGALGTFFGGPIGATIGSNLAGMAGSALGLELEGLSQEDREFEAAKQFVRFAGQAVQNALEAPPAADPGAVAQGATVEAARMHAPGFLGGFSGRRRRSGTWVRRGGSIIVYGV